MLTLWLAFASALAAPLDVNQASASELDTLPGLGRAKAEAIVAHREANGPFTSLDDLLEVSGIGPGTVANLRGLVRVGARVLAAGDRVPAANEARLPMVMSASTVDPNTATMSDLVGLPGISPARAEAILADRDRNGPFSTCDDLGRVEGIGPATVAGLRGLCAVAPAPAYK
jgi:competence protein ComEA